MKALRSWARAAFYGPWDSLRSLFYALRWTLPPLHPQLYKVLRAMSATKFHAADKGRKVLFFAVRQDRQHLAWELVIAQALRLRGHRVDYVACDGLIRRSCNERFYPGLSKAVCESCRLFAKNLYGEAAFPVSWLKSFYKPEDAEEAERLVGQLRFEEYRSFVYDGLPLGELARPSACHFTRTENIELHGRKDPLIREIYRGFLIGAVLMLKACRRILDASAPDRLVLFNGMFISERVMLELAKARGIETTVIETGLRPDTLTLVRNHPIDYGKVEGWESKKPVPLTQAQDDELSAYMSSRRTGSGQSLNYWRDQVQDRDAIRKALGLESFNKVAVLFPNVTWDSALYGLEVMFSTLHEWIEETLHYFEGRPEDCLVIRTHPADSYFHGGMRDSIFAWLKERFPSGFPRNVKVVAPDDPISSYAVMDIADLGLVFTSTTGLEMALAGKPVVCVGKVHYWGRGFTIDPSSRQEYVSTLDRLLDSGPGEGDTALPLARRYAHFIFFEASIPLKAVYSNNYRISPPELQLSDYSDLLPGKDTGLDAICDGIIEGTQFVI